VKRVVVIGAGDRVIGAILPALWCLRDRFAIQAVVARSRRTIVTGGGALELATVDSLSAVDFSSVDLVVVAATTSNVPNIIGQLTRRTAATLMLDTPVVLPSGLPALRKLGQFRRVLVAEDTLALPPYALARRLVEDGAIGSLRRILFFHCGYKYHALASLKLLAGARRVTRISDHRYASKLRIKDIELDNGVHAVMHEPRDYAIGKFVLEGDNGAIADYDLAWSRVRRISYDLDGPIYRGLRLDGEAVATVELDDRYRSSIGAWVPDATPMNTMKIRGLIDLLAAAFHERSPLHYAAGDAVADALQIRIADRLGFAPAGAVARLVSLIA
jgi:hypothetical protein